MPAVTVAPAALARLQQRHPWVFAAHLAGRPQDLADGEIVSVFDGKGRRLGTAFYDAQRALALRLIRFDDGPVDAALIRARLHAARARRARFPAWAALQARRLCHSEADALPGLIIDRYAHAAVVQYLCAGMTHFRDAIDTWLREEEQVTLIVERGNRGAGQEAAAATVRGTGDTTVTVTEHGLRWQVDLCAGQKTGFFLDQRDNRALIRALAAGKRVLDLFSYTGGFALNAAAGGATAVIAVESSAAAVDLLRRNAATNALTVDARQQDVFDFLQQDGNTYDLAIVDPPAPAKNKAAQAGAQRYFHFLLTRTLRCLAPGGMLLACTCSHHYGEPELRAALQRAAAAEQSMLHLCGVYGQPFDHPVSAALPEGDYFRALLMVKGDA